MQRLLFYTQSSEGLSLHIDTIERKLSVQSTVVKTENALRARLDEKIFHLFVVDFNLLSEKSIVLIRDLRDRGFTAPVLIVCNEADPRLVEDLAHVPDIHLLMRPFNEKGLLGIVRKLLISKEIPKQVYRRFNTNQIAHVEKLSSGDSLLTSMYNLSKGGAYFEFDADDKLTVGDVVRMKVTLSDLKSEHTFSAKVVWTTRKGKFSGRFGCGIRFVNSKDIYRMLLSKS